MERLALVPRRDHAGVSAAFSGRRGRATNGRGPGPAALPTATPPADQERGERDEQGGRTIAKAAIATTNPKTRLLAMAPGNVPLDTHGAS